MINLSIFSVRIYFYHLKNKIGQYDNPVSQGKHSLQEFIIKIWGNKKSEFENIPKK